MRVNLIAFAAALSLLATACADSDPTPGGGVNRATLGSLPLEPASAIGARYIVVFRDATQGRAALRAASAQIVLELPNHRAVAAHIPARAVAGLMRNPHIALIEPDAARQPFAQTTPYGYTLVGTDLITEAEPADGPVTVCIIDSGYALGHEDLPSQNVIGTTNAGTGNSLTDTCGHGTHVAGTIAAVANDMGVLGINNNGALKLKIVKVFDGSSCAWAYASTLIAALDTCRANVTGKLVVSMSLGGRFSSITERNAFANANAAGVLSIAAAGNAGNSTISYPAGYASVVSVAAVDSAKARASFSQYNADVELSAPGVGVLSTVPWKAVATVTTASASASGYPVEFAATSTGVTGPLVDGGLCDTVGPWSGQVVLCQRGTTTFFDKVNNVQRGGGLGAVIYNNVAGDLIATLGTGNSSTIPAIGITQTDGQALVASALGQSATLVSYEVSPASGYEAWDGTSMATPHVSGVAARIWNLIPYATNAQVRQSLTDTAEDLGTAGRDNYYGYGLVQAKAALDRLRALTSICVPDAEVCTDGLDNDCDGAIDALDPDCQVTACLAKNVSCSFNDDCCSNSCRVKGQKKVCQ
jgi:subtilisin family serine protease